MLTSAVVGRDVDPFEGEYWDPSDPDALEPVEDPRPWHLSLDEMERLDRARSRLFGAELLRAATWSAAHVEMALSLIEGERGLTQEQARDRRAEAISFARRSAWSQIAMRTDRTPAEGEALVVLAEKFLARCPDTLYALDAGRISKNKALIILNQTEHLSPELSKQLEARALLAAAGRTDGQFQALVRRYVRKADKDAGRRREAKARAGRRVELRSVGDGMFALHAVLPAEEAYAAFGILDACAQSAKKAHASGDERGIDALRADALMDLLRNPGDQDRITYDVRVVVPLGTVLGVGDEDGHIPGHGPIPADVCRRITKDGAWKRLLEDPDTGHLLDVSADTYKPSIRMVDFIRTRDQTCRWPGCRRKAHRTDLDHTIEFRIGGRTIRINLACLCPFHHQLKHQPGWSLVQDPDGTLSFTTPTGDVYRTRPPTVLGEDYATEHVSEY